MNDDIKKIESWGVLFLNPVNLIDTITKNVKANWDFILDDIVLVEWDLVKSKNYT